jgi:predicted DNA-binding transcriptional regulator AlpA
MGTRPAWTLTEAVERTGASRSTIRRYREAGKFPNAYKDTAGTWRFPLEDLLAVGLSPSEPARERAQSKPSEQTLSTPTEHASSASAEQVSKLEQALILERTRAENAERLAASYLANVEDLRRALRMLEAGTRKPEQPTEPAQSVVTDHAQPAHTEHASQGVSTPEQPPGRWSAIRRLLSR